MGSTVAWWPFSVALSSESSSFRHKIHFSQSGRPSFTWKPRTTHGAFYRAFHVKCLCAECQATLRTSAVASRLLAADQCHAERTRICCLPAGYTRGTVVQPDQMWWLCRNAVACQRLARSVFLKAFITFLQTRGRGAFLTWLLQPCTPDTVTESGKKRGGWASAASGTVTEAKSNPPLVVQKGVHAPTLEHVQPM